LKQAVRNCAASIAPIAAALCRLHSFAAAFSTARRFGRRGSSPLARGLKSCAAHRCRRKSLSTASTIPIGASGAGTRRPDVMISSLGRGQSVAADVGCRLRRIMPSVASGSPTTASDVATRASQPSASSSAAGARSDRGDDRPRRLLLLRQAAGSRMGLQFRTSEPAKGLSGTISTWDTFGSSQPHRLPLTILRTFHDPALTGGLSMIRTATFPSASRRSWPFCSTCRLFQRP
jgi:hypothetical protein